MVFWTPQLTKLGSSDNWVGRLCWCKCSFLHHCGTNKVGFIFVAVCSDVNIFSLMHRHETVTKHRIQDAWPKCDHDISSEFAYGCCIYCVEHWGSLLYIIYLVVKVYSTCHVSKSRTLIRQEALVRIAIINAISFFKYLYSRILGFPKWNSFKSAPFWLPFIYCTKWYFSYFYWN